MLIRPEEIKNYSAIHAVNSAAFETDAEANLVDIIRKEANPIISLVADEDGAIVGHIMFSPVTITGYAQLKIMGLGPMAVLPAQQRHGIGSMLVRTGLEKCKQIGYGAVVVLGHSGFYPRFGFTPSDRYGIRCEYDVPVEAFMVVELKAKYLKGAHGTIKYHPAFDKV